MDNISDVLTLLNEIVTNPAKIRENIPKFQQIIWNSKPPYPTKKIENILRNLAYDLDYYEADPKICNEDSSFFGEERALDEIRSALAAIDSKVR